MKYLRWVRPVLCPRRCRIAQEEQSVLDPALPPDDAERLRLSKEIELQVP